MDIFGVHLKICIQMKANNEKHAVQIALREQNKIANNYKGSRNIYAIFNMSGLTAHKPPIDHFA